MYSLQDALENITVDELKIVAKTLEVSKYLPNRKAEIIKTIKSNLTTNHLKGYWKKLDDSQKKAISEVVHNGNGVFEREKLKAKYGSDLSLGWLDRYYWRSRDERPILISAFFYGKVLPKELCERFKTFVPEPPKIKINAIDELPTNLEVKRDWFDYKKRERKESVDKIPLNKRDTEQSALSELMIILRLIEAGKITISDKTQIPTSATVKQISKMLKEGDFYSLIKNDTKGSVQDDIGAMKSFAWPLLVQAGNLAKPFGKKLKLTKMGKEALKKDPSIGLMGILTGLTTNRGFDELRRIDIIKGQNGKAKRLMTDPCGRRSSILEAIKDCPANQWVHVNELFRYIQATKHNFHIGHNLWELYICDSHYGSLGYDGFGDWNILQARYALCFLFEYLATLGVIDVAYIEPSNARPDFRDNWGTDDLDFLSRYDGLGYFRINDLGKYCLGLTTSYTSKAPVMETVIKVLPNLEIIATDKITESDKVILDHYAQKKTEHTWKLDKTKVLSNVEQGHTLKDIFQFISSKSENELPQTVEVFFEDLKNRTNSIQIVGESKLLECKDKSLALLIANDTTLKKVCYLAGENHIVYLLKNEKRFLNATKKLGYILN